MFGFFKKAELNEAKIDSFCSWFLTNNDRIIASVENSQHDRDTMFKTLDEVEAQLAVVYRDGYKGEIQFDYGFNTHTGKWDLNLYHLDNKFLIAATTEIAKRINQKLGDKWSANTAR
jgi:hypothetical protein